MKRFIFFSVFIAGFSSMAIEMTASRMIGNIFSSANLIWACVIGSIMIYMAIGNWLGGIFSDKYPDLFHYLILIFISGVFCCLIPLFSRPLLLKGAQAMDQMTLRWVLILFLILLLILFIPMTLLGMIIPFAIKLLNTYYPFRGKVNGQLLAVSTVGSFIGTMLPSFILIPSVGTNRTFFVIGFLLLLAGAIGQLTNIGSDKKAEKLMIFCIFLPILLFFLFPSKIKQTKGQIYEKESVYNYIEVVKNSGYTILRLNDGQGIQSIYHPVIDNYYGPWEQILTAPFFQPAPIDPRNIRRAAILGNAGGTSAKQLLKVFPNVIVDGFEIDPEITKVAKEFFDLPSERMNIISTDGRIGLQNSDDQYDIIMVDAYQSPYISVNMCTQEFFQIVFEKLNPEGVLVMNIGRSDDDRTLLGAISETVNRIFPQIFIVDIPNSYNSVLFAMKKGGSIQNLQNNYDLLSGLKNVPALLTETLSFAIGNIGELPEKRGLVFTDDKAPVEAITNQTILRTFFKRNE